MKPSKFTYRAPTQVDEVLELLADRSVESKVLAGGQSLVPVMSLRMAAFDVLVDLNRVAELAGVDQVERRVRVGAITRQNAVLRSPLAISSVPLLARAIPLIGHFQIRNRGTIGGSIAHSDPAAELPAVALALDAQMNVAGSAGQRVVPASSFFEGIYQTAVAEDEVLMSIDFPIWTGRCGFAVEEVARRHGDFALAGTACAVELDGARVVRAAIALFGVESTPVRATAAEAALIDEGRRASLRDIGDLVACAVSPVGDVHASADYRRSVAGVVVERALARALTEADAA